MILVDGDKYACVQCIRGHRSSTCKHSSRPLVQVRSRGRPSLSAPHRIAVTESEIVLSRDEVTFQDSPEGNEKATTPNVNPDTVSPQKSSCCGGGSATKHIRRVNLPPQRTCCSNARGTCACNNTSGVILLRASKRQLVDVKDGNLDFVGPYSRNSSMNTFKLDKTSNYAETQFHGGHSNVNDLKLLKTLKVNEVDYTHSQNMLNPFQNQLQPNGLYHTHTASLNNTHIPKSHTTYGQTFEDMQNVTVYNQFAKFNGRPPQSQSHDQYMLPQGQYSNHQHQNSQFNEQEMTQPPTKRPYHKAADEHIPQSQVYDMLLTNGCADQCNCGPECTCPGCLIHRTNEELKEYGLLETSTTVSTPSELLELNGNELDHINNEMITNHLNKQNGFTRQDNEIRPSDLINFETVDELLLQEMFEDFCDCNPDDCRCFNCMEHGISEGVRLKDGLRVSEVPEKLGPNHHGNGRTVSAEIDNSEFHHECGCLPEECECYNCPQHGIYNGVRIGQADSTHSAL